MNRQICCYQAYGFTHSEVILYKKFHLLHHQHCPDSSRCWFIACSYFSYPPYVFTALPWHRWLIPNHSFFQVFSLHPGAQHVNFPSLILAFRPLHSFVLAYISLCLLKLVNTNSSLPGSLWAALQSSSGVCYFPCLFIGTFIKPLPQKPWNHIKHRVVPLCTDPTSTARETSLNFNPSQKTLLLLDTFLLASC